MWSESQTLPKVSLVQYITPPHPVAPASRHTMATYTRQRNASCQNKSPRGHPNQIIPLSSGPLCDLLSVMQIGENGKLNTVNNHVFTRCDFNLFKNICKSSTIPCVQENKFVTSWENGTNATVVHLLNAINYGYGLVHAHKTQ